MTGKNSYLLVFFFIVLMTKASSQAISLPAKLPDTIYSGKQGTLHVQGVAIDKANGYLYFSFTDKLVKMDLSGKLIGSVTGFVGHLGDLDFNEDDGKVYGSLEYKNDAIGQGIRKKLGVQKSSESGFYIAVFDVKLIVRPNMNAEKEDLLRTVYLKEPVKDYEAQVHVGDSLKTHRFACSGIDGVAFGPSFGFTDDPGKYLYVAYGVYGDTNRDDNDHQVLLKYDVTNWNTWAQHLSQDHLHHSGPEKPLAKYFIKTGSTNYGIQNLAYDDYTGNFFAAVYRGAKKGFPNYDLFVIDGHKKPAEGRMSSGDQSIRIKTLSLLQSGPKDLRTGIRGWYFNWGSTGLCPLNNGYFYISHNERTSDGQQQCTLHKYKWVGDTQKAFSLATTHDR